MINKNCLFCDKALVAKQKKYCSFDCQTNYRQNQYINRWKDGLESGGRGINNEVLSSRVRRYLLEEAGYKCTGILDDGSICGWNRINNSTGLVPLTIHHIDGDPKNHRSGNLKVLCPNCHSLTETYGSLNKGNGRFGRLVKIKQKKKTCECGKVIRRNSVRCRSCYEKHNRKVKDRPSKEDLLIMVQENGYEATGRFFGVSGNAVRKWLR